MSSHENHSFELMMTEDHSADLGHVVPRRIFLKVFLSLLFLTFVTVLVSRFDFGAMNMVVSMLVASTKAMLVALFFMHLKYENKILWIYAIFPLILLAILIGAIFIDNPYRAHPEDVQTHSGIVAKQFGTDPAETKQAEAK